MTRFLLPDFLSCFFQGKAYVVRHDRDDKRDRRKSNLVNYSSVETQCKVTSPVAFSPTRFCARWTILMFLFFSPFETRISCGIFWIVPRTVHGRELWSNTRISIHICTMCMRTTWHALCKTGGSACRIWKMKFWKILRSGEIIACFSELASYFFLIIRISF